MSDERRTRPELIDQTEDVDPSNVLFRAGFLRGLALKLGDKEDEARRCSLLLLGASRSLMAFAKMLRRNAS